MRCLRYSEPAEALPVSPSYLIPALMRSLEYVARNAHLPCSILLTVPSDEMEPESLNLV